MRAAGLFLLAVLLAGPASAQAPLQACEVVDIFPATTPRPPAVEAGIEDGHVRMVVVRRADGSVSRNGLAPLRPGVSWRAFMWKAGATDASTFNLITVEPAGTILAETWVTLATAPQSPRFSWMRLRCAAAR